MTAVELSMMSCKRRWLAPSASSACRRSLTCCSSESIRLRSWPVMALKVMASLPISSSECTSARAARSPAPTFSAVRARTRSGVRIWRLSRCASQVPVSSATRKLPPTIRTARRLAVAAAAISPAAARFPLLAMSATSGSTTIAAWLKSSSLVSVRRARSSSSYSPSRYRRTGAYRPSTGPERGTPRFSSIISRFCIARISCRRLLVSARVR